MQKTNKSFIAPFLCLSLCIMSCQLHSKEMKPNKPKDITKFSSVDFQPGKMGNWKFYSSKGFHVSTEQHPGLITIRNVGGAEEDLKGTIGQPLPLSEYPPQWEFEVNLIRSQASKRGFLSPDDRGGCDAIGLNVALTFSEPSTWPKNYTKQPKKTYSFQLYSVHLLSPEMGSHEGKFLVWGDGELGELGTVTGGDGVAFPKDKILGDWGIPTYDVGDGQNAAGPSSTDTYFCFRLLSPTEVLFGVRFSQTHPWFTRVLDVSALGQITGVWEIGPIISGSSWLPTQWPGFKRPLDKVETYIGFCDFRYCCDLPDGISIEKFSKDFDTPGNMGGGYQTEFYGLLTETWSHPGYLTWTLRGGYNATGVETVVDYGSQVIALTDKDRKRDRQDSHYRIYFEQPWEVELCFIAPDDSVPWNLFMDWYILDENDNEVTSWLPGIANNPGEGHSVGSLLSESYPPDDKINQGREKKMYAGGDFGPQFTEKVPESILSHKPLYLLFRVIDSRHLQMGVKAKPEDDWILTPVWECPYEIVSLGDSCISTNMGVDGTPAYQQFLIDYWHCREGVSLEKKDKKIVKEKIVDIPIRYGTYANDDCRFFCDSSLKATKTEKGEVDDWMRITCTGVREYIHGIDPRRCALVIVDLEGWSQDSSSEDDFFQLCPDLGKKYDNRMKNIIIPNVSRLIELFRQKDMPIIYTTLGDNPFEEAIKPSQERMEKNKEFVIQKYSDGAFPTSPIDNILREHGIATVFFVGQDTACCVNATVNEAQDRSYQCILIEDGCVASRHELHEAAVNIWAYRGFVRTTDQVINDYPWQNWVYPNNSN